MKNCLVSGCSGFIGTHLTRALIERGIRVRGLSRQAVYDADPSRIELIHGDLCDPVSLRGLTRGVDTVFHAAGFAHTTPDIAGLHNKTTLDGTRHLLAEAKKSGIERFVFISSVKAMPDPGIHCLDESAEGLPEDEYGLSRRQAEELVLEAGQATGMQVCILRPALVYGPGCKGSLLSMLRWIDKGIFPPIPDTGNRRSMVDVRDLVSAIILAAERETANGKICIITDSQDYSTRRIYTAMRSALGKSVSTRALPVWLLRALGKVGDTFENILHRPAFYNSATCTRLLNSSCYHSINAEPALGFHPKYCLEEALPEMVEVYRQPQT